MRLFILILLLLSSLQCMAGEKSLKIATYNIYFLDDGISPERKANLQAVLKLLDADIIGFQEIEDRAALENILGPEYRIAMIDDPDEVQELALAVRTPFRIVSQQYVFPNIELDLQFPRTRDLLEVTVAGEGLEFVCLVHHAKSRRGGRLNNDARREGAARLMAQYIREKLAGRNVVLMGDFNDNPDDRSMNILEYDDPDAPGGIDNRDDTFLFNTTEQLLAKDICSFGFGWRFKDTELNGEFDPVVPGSREENNRWRDKEHDYMRDVYIKETLLDQILVSLNLKTYVTAVGVLNQAVAVKGTPSHIKFSDRGLEYTERGTLASDHIPVWITLSMPGKN
ncbi:MAG: endonuclease/exonuclease/phosphatase family protein [Calditrichaeota bacterium]|nr:endonuclease/exonuclease/phosphatase family protein [Calditrichota bacterium]